VHGDCNFQLYWNWASFNCSKMKDVTMWFILRTFSGECDQLTWSSKTKDIRSVYSWAPCPSTLRWFHSIALHILSAHHFFAWLVRAWVRTGRNLIGAVQRNKWLFSPKRTWWPTFLFHSFKENRTLRLMIYPNLKNFSLFQISNILIDSQSITIWF